MEETLWFRKGQEVAELVSISLDPDITIQENDQYVTIRGSLELTGEYNRFEENSENEGENFTNQKYVQSVEKRESGICEFLHRFPVDITIPYNRIQSIYDIDVMVESFDYTIPERSCLKLSAELTISGLYGVPQDDSSLQVLTRFDANQNENEDENLLFEAEARKQPEDESVESPESPESPESFSSMPYDKTNKTIVYHEVDITGTIKDESIEEESIEESTDDGDVIIFEESSSSSPIKEDTHKKEELVHKITFHKFRSEGNPQDVSLEQDIELSVEEVTESTESSSSSKDDSNPIKDWFKKKKNEKKKSMSLTEFFARKVTEEEQARLKVCLVQKGDTLDRLAERYDVSVSNLLKENHLEMNQDIHEGEVLYIPNPPLKK
ncbi:MAG: stage VI sporulation protein D [Bacillota bacterium]|nr:stage VI sporulation protein D [Bacillota bacterium]